MVTREAISQRAEELREACAPLSELGHAVDADGRELWSPSVLAAIPEAFRCDCDYVWGSRGDDSFADELCRAHSFVQERDRFGFLCAMHEDGAFGAETVEDPTSGRLLSRDLLDSANELCFLEEQLRLSRWPAGTRVLDVGAGYGRLVHRTATSRRATVPTDAAATAAAA